MTKEIHNELQEIRGLIYLLERAPLDKKSHKSTEIIGRIKKLLESFEKHRTQRFKRVSLALSVLVELLEHGHVKIESVEDWRSYKWALSEARYFLDHWEEM